MLEGEGPGAAGTDIYTGYTDEAPVTGRTALQGELEGLLLEDAEESSGNYRVLDLGCGGAGYHPVISDELEEEDIEVEIVGVDLNSEKLQDVRNGRFMYSSSEIRDSGTEEYFQRHAPMMQRFFSSDLDLVAGDAFQLPFRDCSFDAVISQYLETHHEEEGLLDEATRVAVEDGFIGLWDEQEREVRTYKPRDF